MTKHTCRTCWHCIVKNYMLQDNTFFCRVNQQFMHEGTYGPGYKKGSGNIYLDYSHEWVCWTSKDPEEREKNRVKRGNFDDLLKEVTV